MPSRTYQEVLRANLLRIRRDRNGWTQDDLAERARLSGLRWSQSVVASIENGRRDLSAEEVFLLPGILRVSREELHSGVDRVVDVSGVRVVPEGWRSLVAGESWMASEPSAAVHALVRGWSRDRGRMARRYGLSDPEAKRAVVMALRDAEQKAARRLGVSREELAMAAIALWRRGLVEERERRVGEGGDGGEVQQRRGHVTRQLMEELAARIKQGRARRRRKR